MYLKSIEIQGFKSFFNRTVFDFRDGITAIVGPNGSGKSNVADAVRWVLGEQRTSQLRSGSMQDVIFAGTVDRKPLSYASVSLTIDNEDEALPIDYSEVTVTRKLYRSGESEYLINRKPCRLRDIQELFYDTGVGREGYSMIGQGQIDKVISGNPVERRELFDEAAGIVKYKKRKESALKKLEEEQANLVRVDDILSELESQVGPLKEQSEKATRYLHLRDELKSGEIDRFVLETVAIDEQVAKDRESLRLAAEQIQKVDAVYEKNKTAYAEVEERLALIEEKAGEAREKLNSTDKLKTELEGRIGILKEQINSALTSREHFRERLSDLEESVKEGEKRLADLSSQYEEGIKRQKELSDASAKLFESLCDSKIKKDALKEKQEETRKRHLQLVRERGDLNAGREKNDALLRRINAQSDEEEALVRELETKLSQLQEERKTLEERSAELEAKWKEASGEAERLKEEAQGLSESKKEAGATYEKANDLYRQIENRLTVLRDMTERYEGFGSSVKRIMELDEKKVCGVVADLIRAPKEYTEAIETALGRSLQDIVTEDEETARDMITFLKENRFGRATFLPLTAIKGNDFEHEEALDETGVIGTADELVDCDKKYRELVRYLLGRILVVNTLDNAIAIARKYRHRLRIVTPEGDQLAPGGSMSGGAYRNSNRLLARRTELNDLTKRAEKAEKSMKEAKDRFDKCLAAADKNRELLEENEKDLSETFVAARENEVRLKSAGDMILQAQSRLKETRGAIERRQEEAKKLHAEMEKITSGAHSFEDEEKKVAALLAETEEELKKASDRTRDLAVQGENAHAALAACEQSQESLKKQIVLLKSEQENRRSQIDNLGTQGPDTASIVSENERQIKDIQEAIDSSAELFEELNAQIADCQKEKEELTSSHRDALEEREKLTEEKASLEKETVRLEHRIDSSIESREQLSAYMWEEYELTYNSAKELAVEGQQDLRNLRRRTQELKHEIRGLGDVNVNAIEQYRDVGGRYEFMSAQRVDIMQAEESITAVIEDLDSTMKKRFEEAFASINEKFNEVFGVLFGGGKGRLELLEDDILSAGVRVIAQPPGKKLQNMVQLSGGEKSLTAIALLFAIQNLHPSPFCLLDEIEASLDDSNVTRFAEYLHRLSERTQFIVITHRHGTMNEADRLYGITMQEKGVSTMVSVDLAREQIDEEEKKGRL